MRRLNHRLNRWHRYAARTYWNPRISHPTWARRPSIAYGHRRAWDAREAELQRRADEQWRLVLLGYELARILADDCPHCGDPACAGDCDESTDSADEVAEEYWAGGDVRPVETVDTGGLL